MSCGGVGRGGCSGCYPPLPPNVKTNFSSCCPSPCCNPYPPCCFKIIPVKGCCPQKSCRKPRFGCPDPCCPKPDPRCCVPPRCLTMSCPMCPPPPKCSHPCSRWYFKDEDLGPLRGTNYA